MELPVRFQGRRRTGIKDIGCYDDERRRPCLHNTQRRTESRLSAKPGLTNNKPPRGDRCLCRAAREILLADRPRAGQLHLQHDARNGSLRLRNSDLQREPCFPLI